MLRVEYEVKKAFFYLFIIGVVLGTLGGKVFFGAIKRHALDYNKIVVNVPVMFKKDINNKLYPQGEKYLGEHLVSKFMKYGFETRLFSLEDTIINNNFNAGVEIYLRSWPVEYSALNKDKVDVLIETIPYELELVKNMDIVFTGSLKKSNEYKKMGINAYFMPQFTSDDKFYPAYNEKYKSRILFVANQWPEQEVRKSVRYAINNGIKIDIYGRGWENILNQDDKEMHKSMQIANDELKYYYSSADIVLNDTRDDMIDIGIISNRIYDVTACKGFIISDYIPEIEEIYGDAIPMYRTEEEFVRLIDYYLKHPEERKQKAMKAYEITKKRFVADIVVRDMVKIIQDYCKNKKKGL